MAETTSNTRPAAFRGKLSGIFSNPVTVKELRSRMRGRRAFVVLTLYLLVLSAAIIFVNLVYVSSGSYPGNTMTRTAGKGLFAAILGVQVLLVTFIGPAFTAAAVSGERERQTFDLLRTTLLSADAFVLGKLISSLSYILLLVVVSIPLQSIAFLLGGLSGVELILSQVLILVAAITYALYGLWCSAAMRSTLTATVATFSGTLFVTFGIPTIAFIGLLIFGSMGFMTGSSLTTSVEIALVYIGLALAATNLPATLLISEIFLLERDTLIGATETIVTRSLWLPSPWILFIIFHVAAAIIFYIAAVRRVRRVSDV